MERLALIDADSICYIVAYNHKDSDQELVEQACEGILLEILKRTNSTKYLGYFSGHTNFRTAIYKFAKYKGVRPEKPEWLTKWELTIKNYFIRNHKFVIAMGCEADDALAAYPMYLKVPMEVVYCSPDKDLKQIPGLHFDYRNMDSEVFEVTPREASNNFMMQLLTGDTSDNVKGIPGMGEKKAKDLLDSGIDDFDSYMKVTNKYHEIFGDYYGPIIFEETKSTLLLLNPGHSHWHLAEQFKEDEPQDIPDLNSDIPHVL